METQKHVLKAQEIAMKHGKAMAKEMVLEVVLPAIEEAVALSPSPIDDMVVAALKESVVNAVEAV